jgi:hypothetical protein
MHHRNNPFPKSKRRSSKRKDYRLSFNNDTGDIDPLHLHLPA